MNSNQTNTLVVKRYDETFQVCADLALLAAAPDRKSRDKALRVVSSHSHMRPRDMLYSLGCVFNELSERSYYKAAERDAPEHDKHTARADFYRGISQWARACYVMGKEAPAIKDAEDDSDPYVKPAPKADPMDHALTMLKDRLTVAGFSKRRIDVAAALFKSVVLERPVGATVLDVLASFGDEASDLSWCGEYEATRFWDACVKISDDLRGDLVADQFKKASTITVPANAVLWEVTGDPDRALYRTKLEAMRAALELFPDETTEQRYLHLQSRTVKP